MSELVLRNRQRLRRLDTALLRRLVRSLLSEHLHLTDYELGIHLVRAKEMTRINEGFLNHAGSTDVITFAYAEDRLHGELFVCLDEALIQARRFRVRWQSELVRYIVHGVLHLQGHDDHRAGARRLMKKAENELVRALARSFPFSKLELRPQRA